MKTRIYIDRDADRDAMVAILAKNGYCVRQGREKIPPSSRWSYYVEYWTEEPEHVE